MIIKQLKSTQFADNDHELAEIRDKIIHKVENKRDLYFNEKDYEKLLRYYLRINDEENLKIMLSTTMIQSLQSSRIAFSEEENGKKLKDVQFKQLVECVREGDIKNVKLLLESSSYCKSNINKELYLFETQEMTPGASLLHLALKHGEIDIAKLLITYGANLNAVDYYDNTVMHYAGMGGKNTYAYMLDFKLKSTPNLFGHTPEDYLEKMDVLARANQNKLCEQFINYIKLNKYDENILIKNADVEIKGKDLINKIDQGICNGEGFIRAISVLRSDSSSELYEKMSEAIRQWDGTTNDLDKPLNNPILAKEFSNLRDANLRSVFEYMMSVILASQQEFPHIPILDIKLGDRTAMFELLNNKNDKLECLKKSDELRLSRKEVEKELCEALGHPDRLVQISLQDPSISDIGHEIYIVTDKNNDLYYIDSDTPFKMTALKHDTESLNKMIKIMFTYYNRIKDMTTYEYSSELKMKMQPK